jgi:6-phosphogluconolactonase (cycloisomerase 2 family)
LPGTVYAFAIDTQGALTPLAAQSIGLPPTAIVADPAGRHLYVVNGGDGSISGYAVVQSDGMLTPLPGGPVSLGTTGISAESVQASVDPSGHFLYVVLQPANDVVAEHDITVYAIGSDGTLMPAGAATTVADSASTGPLVFDTSGQHVYLASTNPAGGDRISQYGVGSNGLLSPLTPAGVAATQSVAGLAVIGSSAYVLSGCIDNLCDGQVALYTEGAAGGLTATGTITLTPGHVEPKALAFDSASSAYLLANMMGVDTNVGVVYPYGINSSTGALTQGTAVTLNGVAAVTETIYGSHLYTLGSAALASAVMLHTGGQIDHFRVGGQLTHMSSTPVMGGSPVAMALAVIPMAMPLQP